MFTITYINKHINRMKLVIVTYIYTYSSIYCNNKMLYDDLNGKMSNRYCGIVQTISGSNRNEMISEYLVNICNRE